MTITIGKLLVREGLISEAQLNNAIIEQKRSGKKFGDCLVEAGYLSADQINEIFHPIPLTPLRIADTGLSETFLGDLLLKVANHEAGTFTMQNIIDKLCLSFSVIDELIELLKTDRFISIRSSTTYGRGTQIFELTERGRERAQTAFSNSLYAGAAPIPLKEYVRILTLQHVGQIEIDAQWIRKSLSHMIVSDNLLNQLGPAFSSGRTIFLYGPPGTGKSSFAEALGRALPDQVFIPQAIEVGGQVIRVYDPAMHYSIEAENSINPSTDNIASQHEFDPRWKKCRRPLLMVGAEFTLDMLELQFDTISKFYEAPVQMKAANGVFILDDFGRQQTPARAMLNRWIVPLERSTDFLSLHTGMKFEIPFDQIIIFCTNLRPSDLMDEAFLRRIRHKVHIPHYTETEFKEIFKHVCTIQNMTYKEDVVEYLLNKYYRKTSKGLAGSHPRDLVDQMIDFSRFNKQPLQMSIDAIDKAAANYFIVASES